MDQYFAELLPSSPTNSSVSSSDLDTESTGSFFPDRSTTLGTLMGVSFPDLRARAARAQPCSDLARGGARRAKQWRRRLRCRRWWWRCCRADAQCPTSLGEFLRVERTLSGGGGGGAPLFQSERILPPRRRRRRAAVSLSGICCGLRG
ncbi:uncharacterized protein At3g17950-like [Ananas comosus]|uniref:Uncharacterized protein At3g17950-like n=1 Tax=Ananas comosus TaxID=4615 RepID=A0A6P5F8H3_ANACO|nr:uncharacterized protein At3g17950-like [Ananas comosus]